MASSEEKEAAAVAAVVAAAAAGLEGRELGCALTGVCSCSRSPPSEHAALRDGSMHPRNTSRSTELGSTSPYVKLRPARLKDRPWEVGAWEAMSLGAITYGSWMSSWGCHSKGTNTSSKKSGSSMRDVYKGARRANKHHLQGVTGWNKRRR